MKGIRTAFLVGLVSVAISFVYAQESDAVRKDTAGLQGEWSMISGSADGQPLPTQMLNQMKRICKGNEVTTTMAGRTYFKAKITIDPSKTPKTIDYEMTEGITKGKKQLGIYELDGAKLKSCFAMPGAERPSDFSSKPGDGRTLSAWKRERAVTPAQDSK